MKVINLDLNLGMERVPSGLGSSVRDDHLPSPIKFRESTYIHNRKGSMVKSNFVPPTNDATLA